MRIHSKQHLARGGPAALSGLLAAVAGVVRQQAGPVVAVGGAAIDRTPAAVKDWAIRSFVTHDKLVLQLGTLLVLGALTVALGLPGIRHRRAAAAGALLFGVSGDRRFRTWPPRPAWSPPSPSAAGPSTPSERSKDSAREPLSWSGTARPWPPLMTDPRAAFHAMDLAGGGTATVVVSSGRNQAALVYTVLRAGHVLESSPSTVR